MLRNNPDFYTLFNFRREILQDMYPQLIESGYEKKYRGDNADQIRDEELTLSADGIVRNPKSCECFSVAHMFLTNTLR